MFKRFSVGLFLLAASVLGRVSAEAGTVAAGEGHTLVRTPDGVVWTWGSNAVGQLGRPGANSMPAQVPNLRGVVAVAAGLNHSVALTSDGRVWVWGHNGFGQLGDGSTTTRFSPVQVPGLTNVVAVACGENHTVALTDGGGVWSWGANGSGQLGLGDTTPRNAPVAVPGVTGTGVAAGGAHTLVVRADGTGLVWGLNANGQLGDGTTVRRLAPIVLAGVSGVTALSGGDSFSLALLGGGMARSWGLNNTGQLGDGTLTQRLAAVSVSGLSGATRIAAGGSHALAIVGGGQLRAWGNNGSGQVGDGTLDSARLAAVAVPGLAEVVEIGAGKSHSVAVTAEGVVWSWGGGGSGQIGDGQFVSRRRPVKVSEAGYAWKAGTPALSMAPGTYTGPFAVSLSTATPGATIHYTTDGSDPDGASAAYTAPLSIVATTTLKAIARKAGLADSNMAAAAYTLQVAAPTLSPSGSTYTSAQNVTLACGTAGASIRYTSDGSVPTEMSALYTGPVAVGTTTVLKAKAYRGGWTASEVSSQTYTMSFGPAPAPAVSPAPGLVFDAAQVSLSALPGATIRYTTDGREPTGGDPAYGSPIPVSATTTVKARAFHPDYAASAATTALYTVRVSAPRLSLPSGTYAAGQTVAVTQESGATLRYTLDGSEPTAQDQVITSGERLVVGSFTLKVRGFKAGCEPSATASASYAVVGQLAAGAVSAGGEHSTAARPDGVAWAWGSNQSSRLGDGSSAQVVPSRPVPGPVSGLTGVVAVSAGGGHTLALRADGRVWSWGASFSGQVGDGGVGERSRPVLVAGLSDVVAISAGGQHSLALKSDRTVWSWGQNSAGQLGVGPSPSQALSPVQVPGLSGVVAIAAGKEHSLALLSDGRVLAWGGNGSGQLGDGTTKPRPVPTVVSGLTGVTGIAAGGEHSLALKGADSSVWSWGRNAEGQLGDGTPTARLSPVAVSGLSGVSSVSAGRAHSLALKADGSAWSWGSNGSGSLGDGTREPRFTPVKVLLLSGIVAVSAGSDHNLALAGDGVVWAWGRNQLGSIGDGTQQERLVPVRVSEAGWAWRVGAPTFTPRGDWTYQAIQTVTLSTATAGALIHYTLDGSTPTESSPALGSGQTVTVDRSLTLKAQARKGGMPASEVTAQTYTMQLPQPTLSPPSGTYTAPQKVKATCAVPGATLRYTTNAQAPASSDPEVPADGVAVEAPVLLTVRAFKDGWSESALGNGQYTMVVATPTLSPGSGEYAGAQVVTVATSTPGATLHYRTDGQNPSESDPTIASGETLAVAASGTVRVGGWRPGWTPSEIGFGSYALELGAVSAPVLAPAPGAFTSAQSVALSTSTPGALIRYTIDGTEPSFDSEAYARPLVVSATTTLRAQAFKEDWSPSPISGGRYVVDDGRTQPPTFSPAGGSYPSFQEVTVRCESEGSEVHYTTNGLEPTRGDAVIACGGTVTVSGALRLKAKAWQAALPPSMTRVADYQIVGTVSVGPTHTLVVRGDGSVWTWGSNAFGQLGSGSPTPSTVPVQVPGLFGIKAVAAGERHSLALTKGGSVFAWGSNSSGQRGSPPSTGIGGGPAAVAGLFGIRSIAAGAQHSLALGVNGRVMAWGGNASGQLGLGAVGPPQHTPTTVFGLRGVGAIAAGGQSTFAVTGAGLGGGMGWSWGSNSNGQLGDGGIRERSRPGAFAGGVSTIAAGASHTLALKRSGFAVGWGSNLGGQLGDGGAQSNSLGGITVSGFAGRRGIATGASHSLAVADNGLLWAWGSDVYGQLGNGSTLSGGMPQVVFSLKNVVAAGAGDGFSVALTDEGNVYAWGRNDAGQLGDGTDQPQRLPVLVLQAADNGWLSSDADGDGLSVRDEMRYGSDPADADSNGDGVRDGAAVSAGVSPTAEDVDGDGVANVLERRRGTDPLHADTDRDGTPDGVDCYPLDRTRAACPPGTPADATPPLLTLEEPTGAALTSVRPPL